VAVSVYHLAVSDSDCRYLRISGTPSAPVVEADVVITAGDIASTMIRVFSPDRGATLYACGGKWEANPPLGHALDKSVNGGATWASVATKLPGGGADTPQALAGWQGDQSIILTTQKSFGPDRFCKLNTSTGDFEQKQALGDSARPHGLFAVEGTDVAYAMVGTGTNDGLWRTLDRGATWSRDATFDAAKTQSYYHLVVDPDGETITALGYSSSLRAMRGKWGGSWTETALPGGSIGSGSAANRLTVTEDGAVWAYNDQRSIYRRDPGTGTWALSGTATLGNGVGGIWAISSTDIMAVTGGYVYWWDGSTWTEISAATLSISTWGSGGVWAAPALADPVRVALPEANLDLVSTETPLDRVVLINCYPEGGEGDVPADAILYGTIASLDNVALATSTKIYVKIDNGEEELVYDQGGTGFQAGWAGAGSAVTVQQSPGSGVNDELVYAIDRTTDYPSEARVTVRVEAST
jgi:hypothetical protein